MKIQVETSTKTICPNCGLIVEDGVPKQFTSGGTSVYVRQGYKLEKCLYCQKK